MRRTCGVTIPISGHIILSAFKLRPWPLARFNLTNSLATAMTKTRKKPAKNRLSPAWNWLKGLAILPKILLALIIALTIFRLFLPGIVKSYVNKKLNELEGYTGHVEDIDISLYRGAYVIKELTLKKKTDPAKYPFLHIDRTDLSVERRALFQGRLVGEVVLDRPVVHILNSEKLNEEPSKDTWTKTVKALMLLLFYCLLV